jgi:hypothetical protein
LIIEIEIREAVAGSQLLQHPDFVRWWTVFVPGKYPVVSRTKHYARFRGIGCWGT